MKHFRSVHDVSHLHSLLALMKQQKQNPLGHQSLGKGKRLGLLFLNPSLRTRISTQVAASHLGMESIVFNADKDGWAMEFQDGVVMNGTTVEHIKDAAPVLGSYFHVLAVRTFPGLKNREMDYAEQVLSLLVAHAGVPVVSLESATLHPLQSLTDLFTIQESLETRTISGVRPKVVLTWAPHIKALPQCVPNSFAQWMNAWGEAEFVVAHPPGFELDEQFTRGASIVHHQHEALANADFVYVKNWSSYAQYGDLYTETDADKWMLTPQHLQAAPAAQIMHCLPVRRNLELSEALLDGPQSLVTTQAANRVWAAQAVLTQILENM